MEITRVCTKYEEPATKVMMPYLTPIEYREGSVYSTWGIILGTIRYKELKPIRIEQGLEGVRFITYGEIE